MKPSEIYRYFENSAPSHFVSVFSHWLTRDEWETNSSMNVSSEISTARLEQRVSFLSELSLRFSDLVRYDPSCENSENYSSVRVRDFYLSKSAGDIYIDATNLLMVETGYMADDADSIWIDSDATKRVIQSLLKKNNLFLLKPMSIPENSP